MTKGQPLSLDFSIAPEADVSGLAVEARLRSLVRAILEAESATGAWEITVALMSDDELRSLHLRFMDLNEPTDIMTFPYGEEALGGDLAISVDHALSRAAEWGNSPAQEIEFLVAHGVLHLLGWQDTSPEERAAMLTRQEELVRNWRKRDGS